MSGLDVAYGPQERYIARRDASIYDTSYDELYSQYPHREIFEDVKLPGPIELLAEDFADHIVPLHLLDRLKVLAQNKALYDMIEDFKYSLLAASQDFINQVATRGVAGVAQSGLITTLSREQATSDLVLLAGLASSQVDAVSSSGAYDFVNFANRQKRTLALIIETFLKQNGSSINFSFVNPDFARNSAEEVMDGGIAHFENVTNAVMAIATVAGYIGGNIATSYSPERLLANFVNMGLTLGASGLALRNFKQRQREFSNGYAVLESEYVAQVQKSQQRAGSKRGTEVGVGVDVVAINAARQKINDFIREYSNIPNNRLDKSFPWLVALARRMLNFPGFIPASAFIDVAQIFANIINPLKNGVTRNGKLALAKDSILRLDSICAALMVSDSFQTAYFSQLSSASLETGLSILEYREVSDLVNGPISVDRLETRVNGTLHQIEASFALMPGRVSLLVGESGTGKSTLVKILSGEAGDKNGGDLKINYGNLDIARLLPDDITKLVTIVEATPVATDLSIASRIADIVNSHDLSTQMASVLSGDSPTEDFSLSEAKVEFANMLERLSTVGVDVNSDAIKWFQEFVSSSIKIDFASNREFLSFLMRKNGMQNGQTSTGEATRVELLLGLIKASKMLALDEPTANLDTETRKVILASIENHALQNPGCVVLVVSNDDATIKQVLQMGSVDKLISGFRAGNSVWWRAEHGDMARLENIYKPMYHDWYGEPAGADDEVLA